jgi:hypothetical protein
MKIKHNNDKSSRPSSLRDLFRKREYLIGGILALGGVGALALFFLGTMGYGAYLAKAAQYAYDKPLLLKVSEMDFSFLQDMREGKQTKIEDLSLEVALEDLHELQRLREQALAEGIITEDLRNQSVPATLTYRDRTHQARIELAGDMAMQWKDPSRWSLQVKAQGEDRIAGMKQFRLLLPSTGGYLTDWMGTEILRDQGVAGLRGDFVRLMLNGKSTGIVYLEEQFDKELALSGRFGEGVLFKLGEELDIYQESELVERAGLQDQVLSLKRKWQDLNEGVLKPGEFFDLEQMGKLFAAVDFMNHKETVARENLSFRFNPQTGLAEPIARKFRTLNNTNHAAFASFLENPDPDNRWHEALLRDPILGRVREDLDFKRAYIRAAAAMAPVEYVDDLLMRNGRKLNFLLEKVYRNWPAHDLPTQSLYGNQRYIQAVVQPDKAELLAYLNERTEGRLNVHLQSQQELPLEVSHLSWQDSVFFYPEETTLLGAGPDDPRGMALDFQIPEGFTWADSLLPEVKVYYNLLGLSTDQRTVMLFPWPYQTRRDFIGNPVVREANYQTFDFIQEQADNNVLLIPSGSWTVSRDLVIPKNKRLEIEPGARIDILNGAKIFSYSPVFSEGTKDNPVLIKSSDQSAQGIIIIRADRRSSLKHTYFDQISCPREDGWSLSGAVTFYESPVDIVSTTFAGNLVGDDFLNIVRADFVMDSVLFKDINADAFDCDFCTGTVKNSSFVNVGNDGIDVSGSRIDVINVQMDGIGDKGLSAGENSQMNAQFIEIRNAEIGTCSKDRSWLNLTDVQLVKARIGITLFMKKTEFGPAYASAERVTMEGAEIPYLVETNSQLVLDGKAYLANRANVKDILYGAEFGKASR